MSSVNTYRGLKVWQKSMKFVTDIYKSTQDFPDIEKFGLTSQIRRSELFQFHRILQRELAEDFLKS